MGLKGLRGPLHKDDLLDQVVKHFDDVYRQLEAQSKQIARTQQQLDAMGTRRRSRLKSAG